MNHLYSVNLKANFVLDLIPPLYSIYSSFATKVHVSIRAPDESFRSYRLLFSKDNNCIGK